MSTFTHDLAALTAEEIYTSVLQKSLSETLVPMKTWCQEFQFPHGTTLNIPSIGDRSVQTVGKGEAVKATPISTGNVTMTLNEKTGDAVSVLKDDLEDSHLLAGALSESLAQMAMAFDEDMVSKLLAKPFQDQTAANPNNINGQPHRIAGSGTNNAITLADIQQIALSFDVAKVPRAGRILVLHPVQVHSLTAALSGPTDAGRNPQSQQMLETAGLTDTLTFAMSIYGIDIYSSNQVATVASGTNVDGTVTLGNAAYSGIAMSIASDIHKPLGYAIRRLPSFERETNAFDQSEAWVATMRWGSVTKRLDTLATLTSI